MVVGRTSKIIASLTLCDDGTRAVLTWRPTLERWQITVTPPQGKTCTNRWDAKTYQVMLNCRSSAV